MRMMTAPETRPSLLLRLPGTRDQQAWEEFLEIDPPLIFLWALPSLNRVRFDVRHKTVIRESFTLRPFVMASR